MSYMYALRGTKHKNTNVLEEPAELIEKDKIIPVTSSETICTGCYPVSEKLLLVLEMRATQTSVVLLAVYLVCWTPLGVYQFIENICYTWISGIQHEHAYIDQFVLKVFSLFSSVFLPLVYCWKTKLFRREARRLSNNISTALNNNLCIRS